MTARRPREPAYDRQMASATTCSANQPSAPAARPNARAAARDRSRPLRPVWRCARDDALRGGRCARGRLVEAGLRCGDPRRPEPGLPSTSAGAPAYTRARARRDPRRHELALLRVDRPRSARGRRDRRVPGPALRRGACRAASRTFSGSCSPAKAWRSWGARASTSTTSDSCSRSAPAGAGPCTSWLASGSTSTWPLLDGLTIAMLVAAVLIAPLGIASAGVELLDPSLLAVAVVVALLASVVPYLLELSALRRIRVSALGS